MLQTTIQTTIQRTPKFQPAIFLGDGEAITLEFMAQNDVRKAVESGELKHALALSALARVFPIWPMPFVQADP